jgi:hypothetical protein
VYAKTLPAPVQVRHTPEITRIRNLPRRSWSGPEGEDLARRMTPHLKTARGTMSLRAVQAVSIFEACECGGLFGPQRVGAGKTLLTLLVGKALEAKRPLLLIPAALLEKTAKDRRELSEHFVLPPGLQFFTYEALSTEGNAKRLWDIQPDLLILDECHYLKNRKAGRTRRVLRYMRDFPKTKCVAVSGTVMRKSIHDFAHILRWCLKENAPIPAGEDETRQWADAVDNQPNFVQRLGGGALLTLGDPPQGVDERTAVRQVFQKRLLDTKGVVAAREGGVECSLRVSALRYTPSPEMRQHLEECRKSWRTPDGWTFSEAIVKNMFLRQLALGFFGVWDPRPAQEWLTARREWARFVRETLSSSRTLDTELQVVHACDSGRLETETLGAWRAIKDTFTIQPRDVWHDGTALDACKAWLGMQHPGAPGIVWCEHVFFAQRLSRETGTPYYGAQGLSKEGYDITKVDGSRSIIASTQANSTGRNLQMFSRNLVVSCPTSAAAWEQLIGRTHRPGQEADEVTVDVLQGCPEHTEAFSRAVWDAKSQQDVLGDEQKLLLADLVGWDLNR